MRTTDMHNNEIHVGDLVHNPKFPKSGPYTVVDFKNEKLYLKTKAGSETTLDPKYLYRWEIVASPVEQTHLPDSVRATLCPSCGTAGSWAAMAMKCPNCWKTW